MPERTSTSTFPSRHPDVLLSAARQRTVLVAGFFAGICVFFTPLFILAVGLLATYLASQLSDGGSTPFNAGRPLTATDFRAVFAPAINHAPLLLCVGLIGATLAQVRYRQTRRVDAASLAAGVRPFFPEFALLYVLLLALTLSLAVVHGGWPQVHRLIDPNTAPVYLLFMLCATWLAHAVWHYCFNNLIDLFAGSSEREAAARR